MSQDAESAPQVPVGTSSFNQRYLYAFATQAEVLHHLRTQALPEELKRQDDILRDWNGLQPRVAALISGEVGLAERISIQPLPSEHDATLKRYSENRSFRQTFGRLPTGFALLEVDKLVAPQRTVNQDYVARLSASWQEKLSLADLLEICVAPDRSMSPIQHLEIGQNVHVFSSKSSDIRCLGSFKKDLTAEDLSYAVAGGIPAAAIITFVGYGAAPVNVLRVGKRLVLNNGFHRVFALRSKGITHVPVVLQEIRNAALEFPAGVAGLPKEYLLGAERPVVMKDFFEPDFTISIRVSERIKVVTIQAGIGEHEVPA